MIAPMTMSTAWRDPVVGVIMTCFCIITNPITATTKEAWEKMSAQADWKIGRGVVWSWSLPALSMRNMRYDWVPKRMKDEHRMRPRIGDRNNDLDAILSESPRAGKKQKGFKTMCKDEKGEWKNRRDRLVLRIHFTRTAN